MRIFAFPRQGGAEAGSQVPEQGLCQEERAGWIHGSEDPSLPAIEETQEAHSSRYIIVVALYGNSLLIILKLMGICLTLNSNFA